MKRNIVLALWFVALCNVCRGDITITRLEPFETGDQPHWKVDTAKGEATYLPEKNSLETPTITLDSEAIADSSITITIESDAKLLRLKGQDNIEFDATTAKKHTLFLSLKNAEPAICFDDQVSPQNKGLFLATVAGNVEKIPLAFVGANYVTIRYQMGTQSPKITEVVAAATSQPIAKLPEKAPEKTPPTTRKAPVVASTPPKPTIFPAQLNHPDQSDQSTHTLHTTQLVKQPNTSDPAQQKRQQANADAVRMEQEAIERVQQQLATVRSQRPSTAQQMQIQMLTNMIRQIEDQQERLRESAQ